MTLHVDSKKGRVQTAETVAYRSGDALSRELHGRALQVMPGGNSRHSIALAPYPIYAKSGEGCRITDAEGEERIDFINNFTSLILGHAHPEVSKAVCSRVDLGTAFAMPTEADVELAELLVERIPGVEQLRFCNSGSEAVLLAVRAARAFTGKTKIAKFEGAYHGLYDYVQVSELPHPDRWGKPEAPASVIEPSISPNVPHEVIVLPWNNFAACRQLISENASHLAAVVVDPLPAGIGFLSPHQGFLELLRDETVHHNILLIADEVMSLRLSYHGAFSRNGLRPDLVCLGKIIGGGFPVGAIGGSRSIMSVFDHTSNPKVHHGGTFNANPVTMTAGATTLKVMTPEAYDRLNGMGDYLREQLTRMLADHRIPSQVSGEGSLFAVHLTSQALIDFRSLVLCSHTPSVSDKLCHELLARGIVISPRGVGGSLSTPMTTADLDIFVDAVKKSLLAVSYKA
ncbi:MAG TPA: aspartate aminotransferase family protein [Terriglobales bacterium]|nr:aspartate aminotransferase family protein [Terriglobales bacterium]